MAEQRIMHGAKINTATPTEVAAIIAAAFDRQRSFDYHREKGAVNLDATGAGIGEVHLSRHNHWLAERLTLTGGANTLIQLMENSQDNADLLEVVQLGTGGLYSDGLSNKTLIPAGTRLLVVVTGGTASGQVTFNLQVRLIPADR